MLELVFTSSKPHVVGREALLEDAVDDFLQETTRQKPWLRARYAEPFCGACSRIRLTSDAKLRPCLLNDREFDLQPALLHGEPVAAIQEAFLIAAHRKVTSGITTPTQRARTMVAIGG